MPRLRHDVYFWTSCTPRHETGEMKEGGTGEGSQLTVCTHHYCRVSAGGGNCAMATRKSGWRWNVVKVMKLEDKQVNIYWGNTCPPGKLSKGYFWLKCIITRWHSIQNYQLLIDVHFCDSFYSSLMTQQYTQGLNILAKRHRAVQQTLLKIVTKCIVPCVLILLPAHQ